MLEDLLDIGRCIQGSFRVESHNGVMYIRDLDMVFSRYAASQSLPRTMALSRC